MPDSPTDDAKKTFAPWSTAQVATLNAWQISGLIHPFTCKHTHRRANTLQAGQEGWYCPRCDYTQNWAHDYMVDRDELHRRREQLVALEDTARARAREAE
jgi:transposase-like protein